MNPIWLTIGMFSLNLVAFIIAILLHAISVAKWASRIEATLVGIQKDMSIANSSIEKHRDIFFTKEEALRQIQNRDRELRDLWAGINEFRKSPGGSK